MIKVADFMINTLAERGIDRMFVVYGAANGDLIDAFTRTGATQYVAVMHEQAGGFAAEGYAKVKGLPGVAIATSGPGGMNLLTAMGNCFYDSVPCVFLTGQINSRFLRPDPSIRQIGFQETDIVAMATPVTKYAKMIVKADDVRYELEKALWLSQQGRPGPVLLDIPLDIQKTLVDAKQLIGFEPPAAASFDVTVVDDQIGRLNARDLQRLCAILRHLYRIAFKTQAAAQHTANFGIIVNYEDCRHIGLQDHSRMLHRPSTSDDGRRTTDDSNLRWTVVRRWTWPGTVTWPGCTSGSIRRTRTCW